MRGCDPMRVKWPCDWSTGMMGLGCKGHCRWVPDVG